MILISNYFQVEPEALEAIDYLPGTPMEEPTKWLGIDHDHAYKEPLNELDIQREEDHPCQKEEKVNLCCCSNLDCQTRQDNCQLKEEIIAKDKEIENLKMELKEAKKSQLIVEAVKNVFNDDQINRMVKPSYKAPWSNKTLQTAIQMYYTAGSTGYEMFRTNCQKIFPSKSCHREHLAKIQVSPGICHDFLRLMRFKVEKMSAKERKAGVVIDEMSIQVFS